MGLQTAPKCGPSPHSTENRRNESPYLFGFRHGGMIKTSLLRSPITSVPKLAVDDGGAKPIAMNLNQISVLSASHRNAASSNEGPISTKDYLREQFGGAAFSNKSARTARDVRPVRAGRRRFERVKNAVPRAFK